MVTIINNQPAEFVHSIVTYTKNLGSPIKKKKKNVGSKLPISLVEGLMNRVILLLLLLLLLFL